MGSFLFFRTAVIFSPRLTRGFSYDRLKKIELHKTVSGELDVCIRDVFSSKAPVNHEKISIEQRPRKVVRIESPSLEVADTNEIRRPFDLLGAFYNAPSLPPTPLPLEIESKRVEVVGEIVLSEIPPAPEGKKPKSEKIKEKLESIECPEKKPTPSPVFENKKPPSLDQKEKEIQASLDLAKKNLEEPLILEGKISSLLPNENPKLLFVSLNEGGGYAVKNALLEKASCGDILENCEVISVDKDSDIKKWPQKETLKTVVFVVDNRGVDTSANSHLALLVSHFLEKNLTVKIAWPRSEGIDAWHAFDKKPSKCGQSLKRAVVIENVRELESPDVPLGTTLQKLVEKRDRISAGISSKESIEDRIKSAAGIYNKGESFGRENIVSVNLLLRGITSPAPSSFRAVLLTHPDGPEIENQKILKSENKQASLLECLKTKDSLEGKVVSFADQYWTISSDIRWDSEGEKESFLACLMLKNCQETVRVNVIGDEVQIDGKVLINPDRAILVCDFKLDARVIPYFNEAGELMGIERTFFGPDAKKPKVGKRRSKLARGITNGASAILFGTKTPQYKVLGEGAENVLSALEVAQRLPSVAEKLGLNLESEKCNCQFTVALGVSDLIKVPIEKSVHTLILIADIDGYNMETKQSLIDTVDAFLKRGLEIKIVFAPASILGKKRDLNDVLVEEGILCAEKILSNSVTIRSKSDLGEPNEPLQLSLHVLFLKQEPNTPENLLSLGRALADLKKFKEAFACYKKAFDGASDETKGKLHHALGSWCLEMNGPDQALNAYKKSIQYKLQQGLDPEGEEVLASLEGMGKAYAKKNAFDLALSYFGKVFQQKVKFWKSDEHEQLASLFFEFGNVDFGQENLTRALFNFQKASQLTQKAFGDEIHPQVAKITEKIGDIYAKQNKHKEAIRYYKHAQEILQKVFCSDRHGLDIDLSAKIGEEYFLQDLFVSSLEHYRKALTQRDRANTPPVLKSLLERARIIQLGDKITQLGQITNQKSISFAHQSIPSPTIKNPNALTINMLRQRQSRVRQVVLDLEMSGLVPGNDRIIEIGCVALLNFKRTGETFQTYVNPERPVRAEAHRITGLTQGFLSKFPHFSEVSSDFLEFIEGADLVIHGSSADLLFLSSEFKRNKIQYDIKKRHQLIDTINIANMLFPGQKNSLDALNSRLKINHPRPKHGALLDAEITADVYLSMLSLHSLVKVRD